MGGRPVHNVRRVARRTRAASGPRCEDRGDTARFPATGQEAAGELHRGARTLERPDADDLRAAAPERARSGDLGVGKPDRHRGPWQPARELVDSCNAVTRLPSAVTLKLTRFGVTPERRPRYEPLGTGAAASAAVTATADNSTTATIEVRHAEGTIMSCLRMVAARPHEDRPTEAGE